MPLNSPLLSRRDLLRMLSGAALFCFGGDRAPADPVPKRTASLLTPELTEGPYYIELERIRRDITEGKAGAPLRLKIRVEEFLTGAPVLAAAVDVWHCDAQGVYSGFNSHLPSPGQGHPPPFSSGPPPGAESMLDDPGDFPPPGRPDFGPGPAHQPDNNQTFLRGVQLTDKQGLAEIGTIFPGWYAGRATHIHLRIHVGGLAADGRYQGGHISHTGQLFFPEEITRHIHQLPAYVKNPEGRVALKEDGIYLSQSGQPFPRLTPLDSRRPELGLISESVVVIDSAATPGRI